MGFPVVFEVGEARAGEARVLVMSDLGERLLTDLESHSACFVPCFQKVGDN